MTHTALVPTLMIDIAGTMLDAEDKVLLKNPHVAGVILFKRNITSPIQLRSLTDSIRAINPNLIIATDQEGGRVARLRDGFSPLPAMGKLGDLANIDLQRALSLAYDVGYLMACEVLAVGIDISFAPVLDIDGGSLVIGDRAFHQSVDMTSVLSCQFIKGMNSAGMKATGKHFPGHGSVIPDSHVSCAYDERHLDEISQTDLTVFTKNLQHLHALMPAHVIFSCVDDAPAGFSKIWLQDILRQQMGFDGVIFSDDLSMKAAHIAGNVFERAKSALDAGCDVALICNDRAGTKQLIHQADQLPKLRQNRFRQMKSIIPVWRGDLEATCLSFEYWQVAKQNVADAFFEVSDTVDPTNYTDRS
ncbi:MAG: beta-N-acetylhexosaminidase [Moraxella sp.]|nr:beta-N-acetylhexosaminidase [Moraxella sp.]